MTTPSSPLRTVRMATPLVLLDTDHNAMSEGTEFVFELPMHFFNCEGLLCSARVNDQGQVLELDDFADGFTHSFFAGMFGERFTKEQGLAAAHSILADRTDVELTDGRKATLAVLAGPDVPRAIEPVPEAAAAPEDEQQVLDTVRTIEMETPLILIDKDNRIMPDDTPFVFDLPKHFFGCEGLNFKGRLKDEGRVVCLEGFADVFTESFFSGFWGQRVTAQQGLDAAYEIIDQLGDVLLHDGQKATMGVRPDPDEKLSPEALASKAEQKILRDIMDTTVRNTMQP